MTVDRAASRGDSHQNPFWPASEPFAEQPCDPDRPDDQYSFAQDFQSYSDTHLGAETAVDGWTDTLASTHPSADEAFFWLPDQQWAGSTQDDWSGEADTGERWGAYREWEEPGAASFDPFDPAQEHSELAVDHAAMVRPSWPPLRQLLAFGEGGEAPSQL